jgi:hypothetical protein
MDPQCQTGSMQNTISLPLGGRLLDGAQVGRENSPISAPHPLTEDALLVVLGTEKVISSISRSVAL